MEISSESTPPVGVKTEIYEKLLTRQKHNTLADANLKKKKKLSNCIYI